MPSAGTKRLTLFRQSGATLMEVLVSVVVTSIGLLGTGGLLAVTAKVNQDSYLRVQATIAAQALIESMHINPSAVADGQYDGAYANVPAAGKDCRKNSCSPRQRADYDRLRFDHALNANISNAKATLQCVAKNEPRVRTDAYDGTCRLEVNWSQHALMQSSENGSQSLVWIFQP